MNISERLKSELAKAKAFSESGTERKNDVVRVNKKNSLFGRIIPLAGNDWFAKEYSQFFMNYTKSDGSRVGAVIEIDMDDPNDIISNKVKEVLAWNASHNDNKVIMSDNERYGFNVQHKVEVVAIPVTRANNVYKMELSTKVQGMPNLVNYQISRATYYNILGMLSDGYMIDGKPFSTELSFVTLGKTYPLSISINKEGKGYDVALRADIQLPAINPAILKKDSEGNYKYIDNPEDFHVPTYKANPQFASMIANIIGERLDDAKKRENVGGAVESTDNSFSNVSTESSVTSTTNDFGNTNEDTTADNDFVEQDPFADNANPNVNKPAETGNESNDDFGDFDNDDFGDFSDDDFDTSTDFNDYMSNNN